jgi:hypothetical protein
MQAEMLLEAGQVKYDLPGAARNTNAIATPRFAAPVCA